MVQKLSIQWLHHRQPLTLRQARRSRCQGV